MAADRPACARLVAVAPAGCSAAPYTITRDTTHRRVVPAKAGIHGSARETVIIRISAGAYPRAAQSADRRARMVFRFSPRGLPLGGRVRRRFRETFVRHVIYAAAAGSPAEEAAQGGPASAVACKFAFGGFCPSFKLRSHQSEMFLYVL